MTEKYTRWVCRVLDLGTQHMGFPLGIAYRVPNDGDPAASFVKWYEDYAPHEVPVEFHSSTRRDTVFYDGTHKDWKGHKVVTLTTDDFQMVFIESDVYTA